MFSTIWFSHSTLKDVLFDPSMIQKKCENELCNSQNDPLIMCQELAVKFGMKDHHENLNGNLDAHKI